MNTRQIALRLSLIRRGNGGTDRDRRVLGHGIFDDRREYLESVVTNYDAFDTCINKDESVLVHIANIARVHPEFPVAVAADNICGLCFIFIIANHHCRAADTYFTFFAYV